MKYCKGFEVLNVIGTAAKKILKFCQDFDRNLSVGYMRRYSIVNIGRLLGCCTFKTSTYPEVALNNKLR
jgi:hypothetical protein